MGWEIIIEVGQAKHPISKLQNWQYALDSASELIEAEWRIYASLN